MILRDFLKYFEGHDPEIQVKVFDDYALEMLDVQDIKVDTLPDGTENVLLIIMGES